MNQEQIQLFRRYLGFFLRRKKTIFSFCLLALLGGLAVYLRIPKEYMASSMIVYQTESINPSRKILDAQKRVKDMVSTVGQQVTSRSSLEEIINEFKLFIELREKFPMEYVVEEMRKRITTELGNKGDVFTVTYRDTDPKKVMLVTNNLAARFVEENLKFREEKASETSSYVKDELQMAREALDKKEAVMRDYKLKYYNEMADQLQINITRLNALQGQQQTNQDSIQDLERTKALIQEQIAMRQEILTQRAARYKTESTDSTDPAKLSPDDPSDINRTRLELYNLRTRYTEDHPEVKRLSKQLAMLLDQQKNMLPDSNSPVGREELHDPQINQLRHQLGNIEYAIKRLDTEREETARQITQYQEWISAAPIREAEWSALTRDYNQLNEHYQQLVVQKLQAESTESLERRQKGSQFKIVDQARLPVEPFSPNFKKIMALALVLGLGLGGSLAFILETLDTSFKDPAELEAALGLSVTCSLPKLLTTKEERRARWASALWGVFFSAAFLSLAGAIAYLWKKGYVIV